MEFTLEPLVDYACHTGENPLYHPQENALYWTDIPRGYLFRYELDTGDNRPYNIGRVVGGFTVQADGKLLLFLDRGAVALWSPGSELDFLIEEISEEHDSRFNDVMADSQGRVFCGTMSTARRPGRLYRLNRDATITKLLDGIGCANGMGLTQDKRYFYFTDTSAQKIYRFNYLEEHGGLKRQRPLIVTEDGGGLPDGMTLDAAGNLWSCRWDGSCIVGYTPQGHELARVPFPVKKVSSLTFGGPNYDQLFVTTAGGHQKDKDGELAGALFRLTIPGVHGVPEYPSRVGL